MRTYSHTENFPENKHEAHKMIARAYYHLRNRDVEFDTLDARFVLNKAMTAINAREEVAA